MPSQFLTAVGLSLVRHGITLAAGMLVTFGLIQDGMRDQVVGSAMAFVVLLWSFLDKLGRDGLASALRQLADSVDKVKITTAAALVFAFVAVMPGNADAASRKRSPAPAQTRGIISTVTSALKTDDFWTQITKASLVDLDYAVALETAAGTPGSLSRAKCWTAWSTLIKQTSGANVTIEGGKLSGEAFVFTRAAQMAQVADALQPDSPFMTACSPVAQRMKTQVGSMVGLVVKGSLSLATFGL
jgi:hypothetical protein